LTKRIDPTTEVDHLNKFSLESFTHRIGLITNWVEKEGYL